MRLRSPKLTAYFPDGAEFERHTRVIVSNSGLLIPFFDFERRIPSRARSSNRRRIPAESYENVLRSGPGGALARCEESAAGTAERARRRCALFQGTNVRHQRYGSSLRHDVSNRAHPA